MNNKELKMNNKELKELKIKIVSEIFNANRLIKN